MRTLWPHSLMVAIALFVPPIARADEPLYPIQMLLQSGGSIVNVDEVTVNNDGTWLARVLTPGDGQAFFGPGFAPWSNGAAVSEPFGATVMELGPVSLNNVGAAAAAVPLAGPPPGEDSAIYLGSTALVMQEGRVCAAPQAAPNTTYRQFANIKLNDLAQIGAVAVLNDPSTASDNDRAIVLVQLDEDGNVGSESILARTGTVLPGQVYPIEAFFPGPYWLWDGEHEFSISDSGHVMYFADLAGPALYDGVIVLNGKVLAQEGRPSPSPGLKYVQLSGQAMEVNNHGRFVFKAEVNNGEMIVNSRGTFVKTGDPLPQVGGYQLDSLGNSDGPVEIDDMGNILWWGWWDDPQISDMGLFLNDVLLVEKFVTEVNGVVLQGLVPNPGQFAMSDNGRFIVFTAVLYGSGTFSAFRMEITPPPAVPDGQYVAGAPMRAAKNGPSIDITWDAGRCPAANYHLMIGQLADVAEYEYDDARCALGTSGEASFVPPEGDLFWVIVGVDERGIEGVHGFDSQGAAREAKSGYVCGITGQIRGADCAAD